MSPGDHSPTRRDALRVFGAVLLVAALWGWHLDSASPPCFDWSSSLRTDETAYTIRARTSAIAGEYGWNGRAWIWDDAFIWPVSGWLATVSFWIGGVGVFPLRIPSLLFGVTACALLGWWALRSREWGPPWLVPIFLGLSFPGFVYFRLGQEYALVILLCSVSLILAAEGKSTRSWLIAGVIAGLAFRIKTQGTASFAGLAVFGLLPREHRWKRSLVLAASAAGACLVFWLLYDCSHREAIATHISIHKAHGSVFNPWPPDALRALKNLALSPRLTNFGEEIVGLVLLGASGVWAVLGRSPGQDRVGWAVMFAAAFALAFAGILDYQALRYRIYVLVPVSLLAGRAFVYDPACRPRWPALFGAAFGLGVAWMLQGLGRGCPRWVYLTLSGVLALACAAHAGSSIVPVWRRRAFLQLCLLAFILQEGAAFYKFHASPDMTPSRVSLEARTSLSGSRVRIVGGWVPGTLLYDSGFAYHVYWFQLDAPTLRRLATDWGLTHYAIVLRRGETPPIELVPALGRQTLISAREGEVLALFEIRL